MEKNRVLKASVLMLLILFLSFNGCASVKYVMSRIVPAGNDSYYGNKDTVLNLSELEIEKSYKLACYFQENKKYKLSLKEFEKVVLNDPGHALAYNGMGVSYDLMGDYKNAVQSYKKALKLDSELDFVHNNLGYSYSLQGRFDEAIDEYKKAIQINPAADRYHNNLGNAYARKGYYELALAEFEKTADESHAHEMLARILYQKGLYEEAREQFAAASRVNPEEAELKKGVKASIKMAEINRGEHAGMERKADLKDARPETGGDTAPYHGEESSGDSSGDSYIKYISPGVSVVERKPIMMDIRQETVTASSSIKLEETSDEIIAPKIEIIPVEETAATLSEEDQGDEALENASLTTDDSAGGEQEDEPVAVASLVSSSTSIENEKAAEAAVHPKTISFAGLIVQLISDYSDHPIVKNIAASLVKKGFTVEMEANGDSYKRSETKLYYCFEQLQEAYQAAKSVPGWQNMDRVDCEEEGGSKIKIVIGHDLIPDE